MTKERLFGFRPLNGVLFYLRYNQTGSNSGISSFRPLNGVLFYLRTTIAKLKNDESVFSSPQRGSFLSTLALKMIFRCT